MVRIQSAQHPGGMTYSGVIIRKGVIDAHVFEVPLDMGIEETLYFFVVELGVDEYSSNIGLDNVRQALSCGLEFLIKIEPTKSSFSYLWRILSRRPIISGDIGLFLGLDYLINVFLYQVHVGRAIKA